MQIDRNIRDVTAVSYILGWKKPMNRDESPAARRSKIIMAGIEAIDHFTMKITIDMKGILMFVTTTSRVS